MKIVKYIFLLLLLSVIAVTVFIATQEGKYDIRKERVIKVPKSVLYNYINDYRNWENVGIITDSDTTAVYSYTQNLSGKGASMNWKNDGMDGKITTVKLVENDSILQKAVIDNLNSEINWGFKDTIGGTKISVRMKGQLSFKEKAYAVLNGNVDEKMQAALSKGLENLNTFLVHELGTFNVEVKGLVTKTGVFYLGQAADTKIVDVQKKAGEILPKLQTFIKTNKIVTNGAPFILYKIINEQQGTAAYKVCIPIKEEIFTAPDSEYEGGKIASFQALKTTLNGDYSHLPKAWTAAKKNIAEKSLQENTTGQYLEVYSRGTKQTKKPSGWVTDIYIPIGAPTIAPAVESSIPLPVTTVSPVVQRQPSANTTSSKPGRPANKPAGTTTAPRYNNPAAKPPQSTIPVQQPTNR